METAKTQTARLRYLHIAPRKVRLIADTVRGLSVSEAEARLLMQPQRSARELLKLLRCAAAGAKNNQKLDPDRLVISQCFVDQGPMLKRSLPRAMGRATPIHKKMSHVTIILREIAASVAPRFTVLPPPKKEKKGKKKSGKPEQKKTAPETEKPMSEKKGQSGFFKRMFRRKSV